MRYRLPEELCGADYEAATVHGGVAMFDIPGIGRVMLPATALTEVEDPLPPEPPAGTVLNAGEYTFKRVRSTWYPIGETRAFDWPDVCKRGIPVRLVPALEPVSLPWDTDNPDGAYPGAQVRLVGDGDVRVSVRRDPRYEATWIELAPSEARAMAAALLAAADAAEATP